MSDRRQRFGRLGEDTAGEYLRAKGYTILRRNFRTSHGEIDIIAVKEGVLTFIEVKTRASNVFNFPEDAVNYRKRTKLQAAAQVYLDKQQDDHNTWQFDVLAITWQADRDPEIEHFENIIP